MSVLISNLQNRINALTAENQRLTAEKQAVENDLRTVSGSVKDFLQALDFDFTQLEAKQVNKMNLTLKIVTKFSKKETQESFGKNWDKVAPILAKYQHLAQPTTINQQPSTNNPQPTTNNHKKWK
jgi:uncharacterized protein (DUF3084 family)